MILGFVSQDSDILVSQGSLGETRTNSKGSLTMFISVAIKENVNSATIVWTITEIRLNPGSLQELLKCYLILSNLAQTFPYWSWDMEGHAKKCVERYCELENRTTQQLYKVASPCLDDHQNRRRNGICRRIAPDRACDTDLVRLISRIGTGTTAKLRRSRFGGNKSRVRIRTYRPYPGAPSSSSLATHAAATAHATQAAPTPIV